MAATAYLKWVGLAVNSNAQDPERLIAQIGGALLDENGAEVEGPGGEWMSGTFGGWATNFTPGTSDADVRTKVLDEIRLNFQDDTIAAVWMDES
jgi:hypothetical protein